MSNFLKKLWQDETGLTAIEYGIMAGILLTAIGATIFLFRDRIQGLWESANETITE